MKKTDFFKSRIFYNFSLSWGIIFGMLLERYLLSAGKEGAIWHIYKLFD